MVALSECPAPSLLSAGVSRRRHEAALVILIAGVCAAGIITATRSSYFYADDWLNLAQAREHPLSWDYLKISYFGHFAPVHRLLDWMWSVKFPLNWDGYLAVMVGLHAIAVAATYVLLRVLRCSVVLAAIATAMFASSVIWVRVIQWPASGEHVAAALAATAVALAASMRWFERRSPWLLAVAAAAMAVGLLAYEKPVLIVMYVVLLRYFLLAPSLQPRAVIAQARTDWPLLATLVGVAAVYGAFLRAGNYGTVAERPGVGQMLEFLGVNWVRGTGTLVIGQAQLGSFDPVPIWLVVAAQVVLAAAVIISIRRHRSAWRAWAFLLVTWLVNMGLIGLSRIVDFGTEVGLDPRYNAEMALLLPIALALAFRGPDNAESVAAPPAPARGRPPLATVLPVAVAALLLTASCANAYNRVERSWGGARSQPWVKQVRASAPALRGRDGRVSVIDAIAPYDVVALGFPPYNRLSRVLPLVLGDGVDFDGGGERPAVVEADGSLRPARLSPVWSGLFPAPECGPRIVRRTVFSGSVERRGLVRVGVQPASQPAHIDVLADHGAGLQQAGPIRLAAGAEAGGVAAEMKGLRALELHVPEGACVQSLATVLAD
jgi:hypothetical protein